MYNKCDNQIKLQVTSRTVMGNKAATISVELDKIWGD